MYENLLCSIDVVIIRDLNILNWSIIHVLSLDDKSTIIISAISENKELNVAIMCK